MQNIVLIGMPAAGKSTIGVLLAKATGRAFLDTDLLLQEQEKKLLQQIIDTYGINRFLEMENKLVSNLNADGCVIATGGSLIYSHQAVMHLKENGLFCYLELDLSTIEMRLNNISTRGIVMKKGQQLKDLYRERSPLYKQYADFSIACQDKNIEQIVNEITAYMITG